jgi:fermentation-respiration switch protein FrsA (DUF1100 family)
MRKEIEINAEGVVLRGWLYAPDDLTEPAPIVVMAHGFSAVKEQYLDRYSEVFSDAGLSALVFDHRNFGASDGTPRQEIDPWQQIRDYRHAITFASLLPEVDKNRIGIWGTSFSGGHVLVVGAIDSRVKCVVAQAPTISGSGNAQRRIRPDLVPATIERLNEDRVARFEGKNPMTIPVVGEELTAPCALAGKESWDFFQTSASIAPAWRNEITLRTAEMAREYEPGIYISRISPKPLLMIVATHDTVTPTDLALKAYEQALQPKKLVLLSGGHFVPYVEQFEESSNAAKEWFTRHL